MPIFDVLRIHTNHLAKVQTRRSELHLADVNIMPEMVEHPERMTYTEWRQYVHETNKKLNNLTSITVKHTFTENHGNITA